MLTLSVDTLDLLAFVSELTSQVIILSSDSLDLFVFELKLSPLGIVLSAESLVFLILLGFNFFQQLLVSLRLNN